MTLSLRKQTGKKIIQFTKIIIITMIMIMMMIMIMIMIMITVIEVSSVFSVSALILLRTQRKSNGEGETRVPGVHMSKKSVCGIFLRGLHMISLSWQTRVGKLKFANHSHIK